ncbi:4a-hydroxytetrahydrobiopterin dehydratase [Stackebrandtia albiflava]|uniref:Putative pterin-4-alpha-carbinolamine dehydratase n=1 Tax=Stackebrandtia albiflava TaxID=406432 RepID=A0A562URH8_9ACTN|nr:4a-hydroxytetrahydrobiopterin dehydratase [Stackebrandtia albiflava]TWJ08222.1 4a-hydroxytetrahydrobiopterin dehydratase [Stackebrandtia albiflava]
MTRLTTRDILAAGLDDWHKLAQALHARYRIPDFAAGAAFVAAVAEAAEAAGHHPDLRLTYGVVDVSSCTHDEGYAVTEKDVALAHTVSRLAREHGLEPEPAAVTQIELALDTADRDRLGPFWSVLLTGEPGNVTHDSVFDPTGRVPVLWFQDTDAHPTPRQRWHIDLWLAPEVAEERIRAAVEAGGVVVDASEAPSFTVLADPDGNKACVCTALDRS